MSSITITHYDDIGETLNVTNHEVPPDFRPTGTSIAAFLDAEFEEVNGAEPAGRLNVMSWHVIDQTFRATTGQRTGSYYGIFQSEDLVRCWVFVHVKWHQ